MEDETRREVVNSVKEIIIENIHAARFREIVDLLEKKTGYSYSYIRTIFREFEKETPHQLFQREKLEEEKAQLSNTSYPIWEISNKLGFQYTYYFTRWFKRHTDCTPTEWRKK